MALVFIVSCNGTLQANTVAGAPWSRHKTRPGQARAGQVQCKFARRKNGDVQDINKTRADRTVTGGEEQ